MISALDGRRRSNQKMLELTENLLERDIEFRVLDLDGIADTETQRPWPSPS
ncbi:MULTISPECIES: hypothetical protein [Actinomycetes]|uniref:hypothetical protein n=1 Tax=Actinomycetes TaxID=1760 RepID=UPI003421114C